MKPPQLSKLRSLLSTTTGANVTFTVCSAPSKLNIATAVGAVLAVIMWKPNRTGRFLLLIISTCNFVIISGGNHGSLPSIDVHDSVIRSRDVKNEVTDKIGAFEVKNLGEAYQKSMKEFFSQAPACLEKDTTLPKMVMNDGSVRTTFAKTSDSKLNPECLSEEIGVIAKAFDQVDKIVTQIIEDIVGPGTLRYQTSTGPSMSFYPDFTLILSKFYLDKSEFSKKSG